METVLKDHDAMVALYAPYCEGCDQPQLLNKALEKLATKTLHGSRSLKPDGSHPFELSWEPGESPQEPSPCQLSFPQTQALTYRFSVPTAQLVLWLMNILQTQANPAPPAGLPSLQFPAPPVPAPGLGQPLPGLPAPAMPPPPLPFATLIQPANPAAQTQSPADGPPDLPESFWRWLLVGDLPAEQSA